MNMQQKISENPPSSDKSSASPLLRIEDVAKTFSAAEGEVVAIRSASLDLFQGDFVTVVGPSGCGKSTLLQIVAGLLPPSRGRVMLDGTRVTAPPADMVYLFQQYSKSLFPWLTVEENVRFAFQHRVKLRAREASERCNAYLRMVSLEEFHGHYPWQLSGGMQQRVAIARALAAEPRVLLMDEPFSSVDALTRLDLHALILKLWQEQGLTVMLVTHDVDEAVFLSDRVAVLTSRPATISEVIETQLPRPRDPVLTQESKRFLSLRHHLLTRLLSRPEKSDEPG